MEGIPRLFLVPVQARIYPRGCQVGGNSIGEPQCPDEGNNTLAISCRKVVQALRDDGGSNHTHGNGISMGDGVTGLRLDGVPDGVAEIQDTADTPLVLIDLDDPLFDAA